jgi:hypothetical protein
MNVRLTTKVFFPLEVEGAAIYKHRIAMDAVMIYIRYQNFTFQIYGIFTYKIFQHFQTTSGRKY